MDSAFRPRLRSPLEVRLETFHDRAGEAVRALLLRCPLGIQPEPLLLVPETAPLLSCFTGSLSVEEIAGRFKSSGVTSSLVIQLVDLLEHHLFLEGARFSRAAKDAREAYRLSDVRPPALTGLLYPSDAADLTTFVEGLLIPSCTLQPRTGQLLALVSPHIDYRRGGSTYGEAYSRLVSETPDLFLLLGTAHQYSPHLFHLSAKRFQTPLGDFPCDRDFVQQLAARYGAERSFEDEILHKREHSIELQLPFLKYLTCDRMPSQVPILVGGFHRYLVEARYPEEFEEYESFVGALSELCRNRLTAGTKLCVIAGVDMAHVGGSFGDPFTLTPELMETVGHRDLAYLDALRSGNKRKLYDHIAEDGDARKICGFPSLYLMMDLFDRLDLRYRTEIFDYRQAVDYERQCAVTFAAAGCYAVSNPE
jgi:MEMO1 family protein